MGTTSASGGSSHAWDRTSLPSIMIARSCSVHDASPLGLRTAAYAQRRNSLARIRRRIPVPLDRAGSAVFRSCWSLRIPLPEQLRILFRCSVSGAVGIALGELTSIMRTWAIWNRSRAVLGLLVAAFCTVLTLGTYFTARFVLNAHYVSASSLSPSLGGISTTQISRLEVIPWILVVGFDFRKVQFMVRRGRR
ncbi:hypothetical protein EXIGLDRAFT_378884 [Exidia glandulosa HHB12029]|uniref:Uncharacterized protein n=1 Tax=Exidia glandulosa HHB12029 TaxID=1314781 RepID=A0A165L555_EXIGL|nr:hypothetical protein EXIGLDRAFT_378884 [Exidia glandulosa HHB12029]